VFMESESSKMSNEDSVNYLLSLTNHKIENLFFFTDNKPFDSTRYEYFQAEHSSPGFLHGLLVPEEKHREDLTRNTHVVTNGGRTLQNLAGMNGFERKTF